MQNILNMGLPLLLIVVFFLVLIIPQRRRDKKMKEMLSNIRNGDKIKTIGGIFGTVVKRSEDTVVIELIPSKTRMMIARSAVASVEKKADVLDDDDDKALEEATDDKSEE
jgi:preprotein translocase subunit YajC